MCRTMLLAGALALSFVFSSTLKGQETANPPVVPQAPLTDPATLESPPECAAVSRFYVFGEILYVWPRRNNLQTAVLPNGTAESLSWTGTPGLRVGIGYRLLDTAWDVGASFAYFHAKSQRTVSAPDGGALQAVLTTNAAAHNATDADGDAGLSYSVLDLDLGRSVPINGAFQVRLFGGVRLASIDQSLKCIYSGGALGDGFDFVNNPVRFQGAGLTAGAESSCDIYHGWGFYGKARLGLLAGQFKSSRTETVDALNISNVNDSFASAIPVVELGVGLRYQGPRFFFSAGYEFINWFNMIDGLAPGATAGQAVRRQGSLTLETVAVRLGFVF